MNRLRTRWSLRVLAATLLLSLLPLSAATVLHGPRASNSFADWVRAQLRADAISAEGGVIAQALGAAAAERPRSLDAFLHAFVAAYTAERPEADPAALFALGDLAPDALIAHLASRYRGLAPDAVPPRASFVAALQAALSPASGPAGALAARPARAALRRPAGAVQLTAAAPAVVTPVRLLSAARPMGP